MVRVPQISQQVGGSVQAQAPGVAPVQDQTGRQLQQAGRSLQIAGQGVQSLGDVIRIEDNTARIKEADALLSDSIREALSPKTGYRAQIGKAAGEGYDQVRKHIEAKRAELAGTLRNDDQRQVFERASNARLGQAQGVIDGHAAHQTRIYNEGETAASIETHKADYLTSLGMNKPSEMIKYLVNLKEDVAALAELKGFGPEQAKQMLGEQMTAVHAAAITSILGSGNTSGAREYLAVNGKSMDVAQRTRAQSLIKNAGIGDKGQKMSEFLQGKGKDYLDRVEMLDAMHERGDISIQVRDDAARRLKTATAEQRSESARLSVEALTEAQEWIRAGNEPTPEMLERLAESGQQWKLDFWRQSGGAMIATAQGQRRVSTITDQQLLAYESKEELWDAESAGKSAGQLDALVGKWAKARDKAGLIAAAERESMQDDLIKADFDDAAEIHYRRLPGVPEGADISKEPVEKLENWKRALRNKANEIGRLKRLKKMNSETIDEAAEWLLDPKRMRVGDQLLSTMSGSQISTGQITLPPELAQSLGSDVLDMNKVTPAAMDAAGKALREQGRQMVAMGLAAPRISRQMIYLKVAEMTATHNAEELKASEVERNLGRNMLIERLKVIRNQPGTQRMMLADQGVSSKVQDYGVPWYAARYEITVQPKTREERLVDVVMADAGADIAGSHGLADAEAREFLLNELNAIKKPPDGHIRKIPAGTFGGKK